MSNLYFIGYRGTGKTTVARLVAQRLGLECIDADTQLQTKAGQSIAELFEQGGEELFRDWESRVLVELAEHDNAIVSLGGGAILRDENRQALQDSGSCVWLTASAETIYQRITADGHTQAQRPALTTLSQLDEIRQLLDQREPIYQSCADVIVDTESKTAAEVAEEVLQWWDSLSRAESE